MELKDTVPKEERPAPRVFYSKSAAFILAINDGQADALGKRHNQKIARFTPVGSVPGAPPDVKWGVYNATDPETIAFLEQRAKSVGDVCTVEQFKEETKPKADQIAEQKREIERLNRLVEVAQQQGKLPKNPQTLSAA
jgi:hypothetical protein